MKGAREREVPERPRRRNKRAGWEWQSLKRGRGSNELFREEE